MIRTLFDYSRYFTSCILDERCRALLSAHWHNGPLPSKPDRTEALSAAIAYLKRAQDHGSDQGIGSYHLIHGWGASYPETTGYIIPTFLACAAPLGDASLEDRAFRAGNWLLGIQRPDGGWQGGRVDESRPSVVFNTAQVMRGLMALFERSKDTSFLDAAIRAANWITAVQNVDGSWSTHNFLGTARVYDTYVAAPVLRLHRITGDERYREAAMRNLAFVLGKRTANGWFADCDNTIAHNDRPITHTIAYTLDGLLECASYLERTDLVAAATAGADALLERFLRTGELHGRYDRVWHGSEHMITTGCAQMAIVWSRLHMATGEQRYLTGRLGMTDLLIKVQHYSTYGPPGSVGALPGSYPLWGRYEKFAFPNWAAKYFADLLLCDRDKSLHS